MSLDLKDLILKIVISGNDFCAEKDNLIARTIYDRHTCQTVLETVNDFVKDQKLKDGYDKYIRITQALIENGTDQWICAFTQGFNDQSTESLCVRSLRTLTRVSSVPVFIKQENYVYDDADFPGVSERGKLIMNLLLILFNKVVSITSIECQDKRKCLVHIAYFMVILISRHHQQNSWTDVSTHQLAETCQSNVMEYFRIKSISELLGLSLKSDNVSENTFSTNKDSIFAKVMAEWQPLLLKATWIQNPVAVDSFCWCVNHLKFPLMSNYLEVVLPPSLLFTDDHILENKLKGVQCLINIIQNTTSEELRWYGRAEVIYEALKHQLYRTEEEVLRLAHVGLLHILKVLVKNPSEIGLTSKYDDIFLMILRSAAHENKITLRRVHTEKFYLFIEHMGINVVKYMKKVLELAEEYLEISDAPSETARINMLKALISLHQVAWPRIHSQSLVILKMLVKLLHHVSLTNSTLTTDVKIELVTMSIECLQLLKSLDSEVVTKSLSGLKDLPLSKDCLSYLESVQ